MATPRCPKCLSPIKPEDVYCEICGFKLESGRVPKGNDVVRALLAENEDLRRRLWKASFRPSRLVGLVLSTLGITSLALSIYFVSNTLAFIGLGITFWGVLLLFVGTSHYVKDELLGSTTRPYYNAIKRLLAHMGYEGQPVYLPPRQIKAMKGGAIFILAEKDKVIDYNQLAGDIDVDQFFIANPLGVCLEAPGIGLANLMEKEVGRDFTSMSLDDLFRNLRRVIIEVFELAEGVEMVAGQNEVVTRIRRSLYEPFYEGAEERIKRIGCPLMSAITIALTRSTGRPITIDEVKTIPEGSELTIHCNMLGGAER